MRVVVEGPDKCGKTTMVKQVAAETGVVVKHLPDGDFRPLVLSGQVTGTAATFLFFANTMDLWANAPENMIIDRDILSMIVYQGYLLKNMDPLVIVNLYKLAVYKDAKPDKIIYLVNEPFEEYDKDDIFESFGYEAIRDAYEEAFRFVEVNFPEIEMVRVDATK